MTRKRWRPLLRCSKVKNLLRLRRNQRKINIQECRGVPDVYLSGEDPRFYKRRVKQYPARLSGGFQSPAEINAPRGCAGIRFGRCQLTLTRIPRQFSRARIESRTPRCSCRDVRGASAPSTAHVCDPPDENPGACVRGSCASRRLLFYKPVTLIMGN